MEAVVLTLYDLVHGDARISKGSWRNGKQMSEISEIRLYHRRGVRKSYSKSKIFITQKLVMESSNLSHVRWCCINNEMNSLPIGRREMSRVFLKTTLHTRKHLRETFCEIRQSKPCEKKRRRSGNFGTGFFRFVCLPWPTGILHVECNHLKNVAYTIIYKSEWKVCV